MFNITKTNCCSFYEIRQIIPTGVVKVRQVLSRSPVLTDNTIKIEIY